MMADGGLLVRTRFLDLIVHSFLFVEIKEDYDAESFSADSKFKEPYMKGGKLDMKRGNDGKFRRRLVVPLEKNQ